MVDNPFLWIAVGHLAQHPFSVIMGTIWRRNHGARTIVVMRLG
jgi:hypothetical protein